MTERVILFTGSRGWKDVATVKDAIVGVAKPFHAIVGDADGFDTIVRKACNKLEIPCLIFHYKKKLGRAGGPVRNVLMLDWLDYFRSRGCSCFVMAGWDGESSGTHQCMQSAEKRNYDIWRVTYHLNLNGG